MNLSRYFAISSVSLLRHRLAELVHLAPAEARQLDGDLQHLILIDDDAVGLVQQRLQRWDADSVISTSPCLALMNCGIESIGPGR